MEVTDGNNLQKYYDYLKGAKADVPPTVESFQKTLSDDVSAKQYYQYLKDSNLDAPDTYESFSETLGLKKKDYVSDVYSKIFSGTLSKVAGDIPQLESSSKPKEANPAVATPEEPLQYPHWTDVSKALGIPVGTDVSGTPETIGAEKKKVPSLEEIKNAPPKESTQPSDKTIAKNDLREPYVFTVEDYLKKRGVAPEEVGLDPKVNTDRLIDVDEKVDFDKKLEAKGLYSPTPKYRDSYVGAAINGLYKGTANMIRDIGYVLNEVPTQAEKAMAMTGAKIDTKLQKMDSETAKTYMDQVASAIDGGLYGNMSGVLKDGYEGAAKWLDNAVKTHTPNNEWGRALESTGAFIPDLISIGMLPEAKAPLLLKYGMAGMLKFPAYLATKTYIEGAKEGKPLKEIIPTSLEAGAQGMIFNGLGVLSKELGSIAKAWDGKGIPLDQEVISAMGKPGTYKTHALEITANSLGFAAYNKSQGQSVKEGLITGIAFSGFGALDIMKDAMAKKATLNWMTATTNNIRMVAEQNVDVYKKRKESVGLYEKAMALPEGEQRDHLLWQKNIVDNTIDIAFMNNQILRNPKAFIDEINNNPLLSAKEKKVWVNKTHETVNLVDPRMIESIPLTEKIKDLGNELQYWNSKTDVDPDVKATKVQALENQIKEQKEARLDVFEKPLDKYKPKEEKKSETAQEEVKPEEHPIGEVKPTSEFPEGYTPKVEVRKSGTDKVSVTDAEGKQASSITFTTEEVDGKKYWKIKQTATSKGHEDKKLSQNAYKYAMENLPEGYAGIISPKETRKNTTQIPHILEKLGKIYDSSTAENGDITLKPKKSEQKSAEIVQKPPKVEQTPEERATYANDRLVDLQKDYNSIPKTHTKKRAVVMRQIQAFLPDSGHSMTIDKGNVAIVKENGKPIRRTATKADNQKLEDIQDPEQKAFITTMINAPEHLYGLDFPMGPVGIDKAVADLRAGRANQGTQYLIDGLSEMHKRGSLKFKKDNAPDVVITTKEVADQIADTKFQKFVDENGGFNLGTVDKASEAGLIDKADVEEIKKYIQDETDREQKARDEWAAEEADNGVVSDNAPKVQETPSTDQKPEEVKPVTNEKPINEPNPPISKGEENNVPGGTETGIKPVEAKGEEKPTSGQSREKQIDETYAKQPWSGLVDLQSGEVNKTFTYQQAKDSDFHHNFLVGAEGVDAISRGEKSYFWIDKNGEPQNMDNTLSSSIKRKITEQLEIGTKVKTKQQLADEYSKPIDTGKSAKGTELNDAVSKYGWSAVKNPEGYWLQNKDGKPVVKVILSAQKGDRYQFFDMTGNKLMDGKGQIGKSAEKLLKDYYYAKEGKAETPPVKETPKSELYTQAEKIITETSKSKLIPELYDLINKSRSESDLKELLELPYVKTHSEAIKEVNSQLRNLERHPELTETPPIEKKAEQPTEGIKFKDKTYQSVDDVLDALDKGDITFEESKSLRESVGKFEDGLKNNAEKNAKDITNRIDKGAGDSEDRIKKDINDKNSKLHLKLFPDLWSALGTAQWKVFRPVRDALANTIAGQLKKGVTNQTDGIRWSTKVLTNLYNGLLRTQADMHGSGIEGQIGKLEMSGAREYGKYKGRQLLDTWRAMVNGDWDSLARVWSVLDPKLATKPTENPLTYGDLGLAEKNLYFAMKEWMTWGHETTYANGLIPTKTYLKFKDVTGSSNYIARMYDQFEMDVLGDPAIREFAERGNDSYTSKIAADIYKARKELNGIIEINGHSYDSLESLKEARDSGEITTDQYAENKDAIKSDEWRREHAIKDPTYLVAKRVMQTIQNVAIKKYMDGVIANHPEYVLDIPKKAEIPKGFRRMGSSYAWGPFRNKVVATHIVEDLTGFFYQNALVNTTYDALKLLDRNGITQFYKKFRTVYNPFVQLGNVTGNVFFSTINGLNPFSFVKGMWDNRNIPKTDPALYERLLKAGYIGPVAMTGEMKPLDVLNPKQGLLGKADELATKAYVGADNLAKISAYQIYRRQGLTHEQAVRRGYDSFQNYATVGKTWDLASKTPLIGPTFVKFQADLQRILVNNLLTAPLTTIGTFMMIKMLGNLSSTLSGETKEEQDIRENRKGVPTIPFMNIPLSFKVGKSEVNVARYLTPLYLYNKGDNEIQVEDISKFMPYQIQKGEEGKIFPTFVAADATWGFLLSLWTDKDFRGMSIADPTKTTFTDPNTPTDVKIWNIIRYVGRSQIPFWKGSTDIYNAATGQLDYYERKRTWGQAILNNFIKIQQFDKPEIKNYVEHNLNYLTSKYGSLAGKMGDAQNVFYKTIQESIDKGLDAAAQKSIYETASKLRDKSIAKSLKEQIPVFQEIERVTNTYKNWYPNDKFIEDNYRNIETGKVQRFNVLDMVDFQKNHKEEYVTLKKNDMLKKPDIPKFYRGTPLTEGDMKKFSNLYWSEYIRQLDLKDLLDQKTIDEMKGRIVDREKADTQTGTKQVSKLNKLTSEEASKAHEYALRQFRNK